MKESGEGACFVCVWLCCSLWSLVDSIALSPFNPPPFPFSIQTFPPHTRSRYHFTSSSSCSTSLFTMDHPPTESVITINYTTSGNTQKLCLTLATAFKVSLAPGPGPATTTLLLTFDDGSLAVSGESIDFDIQRVNPPPSITSLSAPLSSIPSSSSKHLSLNDLSLGHVSSAKKAFQVMVLNSRLGTTGTITVAATDSVYVLRTKIRQANMLCPNKLVYNGVTLSENGASLKFYGIVPGAEISGC